MSGYIEQKLNSKTWKDQNWKKFRKIVFNLQRRIYKAVRDGDTAKAKKLQKLLLRSHAARMLAIRQVTQLNAGKKTAGIDGKASLNPQERFELEKELANNANNWKHQPLREIKIPKKNGKTRTLKVPTIADRAWQCLAKYALEPAHEATFHAKSYGFRTGRSAHDCQKILFNNLSSTANGKDKRVIELDIEKCFDRINHKAILDELIAPQTLKNNIFKALKAGVNPEFPEQGTPQGGVVSPLLANIALNGIEKITEEGYTQSQIKLCKHPTAIRYADDMVIILKPEQNAELILERIQNFLKARGMQLSKEKTKVTAATDGFDFLGWHFKVQSNGKFRSYPSKENFQAFRKKVKNIINNSNYGARVKAEKLAPIVRGWRNYHKYCKMDGKRLSLSSIRERTFKVFNKEAKLNRYSTSELIKKAFPAVGYSENKFVCVKGNKSPYDGNLTYWSNRNSKLYDNHTARTLKKQHHSCGHCNLKFVGEEKIHLHHIDGNHNNGKANNLLAVHESCHDYIHMSKRESSPN
jgi:group II intron reverse transcriptase/maturase